MAFDAIAIGTSLDNRYRVTERTGPGDIGEGFLAEGPDGQSYSLHLLVPSKEPGEADRFHRAAMDAARLASPYVVPVVDHGIDPDSGAPFLVNPVIEGETLQSVIARLGSMNPQAVVRIGIHVARALDEAHSKGVLHRGIRASSVLLAPQPDGTVIARLGSFGQARRVDLVMASTATGTALAAALTRAPEQAVDGKHAGARSDIWALGVLMYTALAGREPWRDEASYEEWLTGKGRAEPSWLQRIAPWIDGALAKVVHGAMIRDPEQRCPSAYALLGALGTLLSGEEDLRPAMLTSVAEDSRSRPAMPAEPPVSWQDLSEPADRGRLGDALVGATLDGRYELLRKVGSGGMGSVYEARDPQGQLFAIKIIKHDLLVQGGDSVRRFVREARAAQAIDSEYVVHVVEAGSDPTRGLPFIVMEMLRGCDLATFVQSNGPMDPVAAAWVFWHACDGLGRAHALGMVHRDVKPANIFLHETEAGAVVPKVCDFGVAKVDASLREHSATALTQTGGILGSPLYMAPEHAENAKHADARSDVWSLGISLYETLTGSRPWSECSTIGELLLALYTKEIPPLQDRAPWVAPELAAIVHRALQREPSRRFRDAGEMAAALKPFASELGAVGHDDLRSVSQDQKSYPAPRLDVAAVSGASPVSTSPNQPPPRRRATGLVFVGTAVLLAAAGATYFALRSSPRPPVVAFTDGASSPAVLASRPLPTIAMVKIVPESALVTIDGTPAAMDGGAVAIARGPGETALVTVESQGVRQVASVVITADGRAVPDRIEVRPPASSSASATPPPPSVTAGGTRTPPTKTTSPGSTQTAAPPAASPTVPKFNKNW